MTDGEKMLSGFGYEIVNMEGVFGETWVLRTECGLFYVAIGEPGIIVMPDMFDKEAQIENMVLSYGIMEACLLRRDELKAAAQGD